MPSSKYVKEYGDIQRDFGTLFQVVKDTQKTLESVETTQRVLLMDLTEKYATKAEVNQLRETITNHKTHTDAEITVIKNELSLASSIFGIGSKVGKFFVFIMQVALTSFVSLIVGYYFANIISK